ncbi:uncharacterized protein LOC118299268 [Scophthalmus maximus]|uniref:uncharacterized protein LOC118299268 n=1 Tax=Scophthalmus maximus TaxID=52904 RepID=UPI0015E15502|nr:uncharacterized protein LOC118299268 [Scophthalmus maximus]XP_035478745.1 uncharacterized protein LOC118299268 [Scophthalmus maximus]
MKGTRTSLRLFLLLNQLLFCPTDAGQGLSTMQMSTYKIKDQGNSSPSAMEPSPTTTDTHTNGTCADCLIDIEMGLIAISSAGGLIVCLLVATVVLACQVCHIQRRVYPPRTSQSNMDLMNRASYWGTDQPDDRGVVGPCDTTVILEEERAESKMEEEMQVEIEEANEEAGKRLEEGATAMAFDPEEKASDIQNYRSRDSCIESPRDLEDMPLVV